MGFDPYKDYLSTSARQLLLMLPGLVIVLAVIGLAPTMGRRDAALAGAAAAGLLLLLALVLRRSAKRTARRKDLQGR